MENCHDTATSQELLEQLADVLQQRICRKPREQLEIFLRQDHTILPRIREAELSGSYGYRLVTMRQSGLGHRLVSCRYLVVAIFNRTRWSTLQWMV